MTLDLSPSRPVPARILIVDDTPDNLAVLSRLLRDHGYEVVTSLNGRRALQVAEREPPDLILLDIRMPEMDGYEVCRRFKQQPALAGIPIIFISAAADPEVKVTAFTSGGVDFVSKPFEPEEVLARVRTHVALRAAERALQSRLEERTEQLLASEGRYRRLVETLRDDYFFYSRSPAGALVYVSPSVTAVLGYPPEDFAAHRPDYLIDGPANRQARAAQAAAGRGERQPPYQEEVRHRDGSSHCLDISEYPVLDPGGAVIAVEGIAHDITQRTRAETALRRTNRALLTLTGCNGALVHATDERQLLAEMCRIIVEIGGYRLAWIGLAQPGQPVVRSVAQLGTGAGDEPPWSDEALAKGPVATVMASGRLLVVQDLAAEPGLEPWRARARRLGWAAVLTLPLCSSGQAFGVLSIHSAEVHAFDDQEVRLLAELAEDLGYGLMALRTRADHERTLLRLETSMEATIQAIANTVEMRDPYTAGHQYRVAQLAEAIARALGMAETEIHGLSLACIVHDLGKIHIPAEILARPGRLSKVEFELIKTHATAGYELLKAIDFPWPIADIVSQHHERLDGSGYPRGLGGEAILPGARIMAVADVVEAMASHRPYRPSLGIGPALAEIEENQGRFYDPKVVKACLTLFREQGFQFR